MFRVVLFSAFVAVASLLFYPVDARKKKSEKIEITPEEAFLDNNFKEKSLREWNSGKSTLLHVLSGLEPFERGSVTIDDVPIAGLSEKEMAAFRNRNIGMVMQQYSLIS